MNAHDWIGTHRNREANRITAVIGVVCALGCASALVPGVERAVTLGLGVLALFALGLLGVRLGARWLRERREDREDALTAAAWRADNVPSHVARPHALDDLQAGRGVS